jgi:hypothetical protein
LNGDSYLILFAQAVYADQFGKHWTRVCYWRDYDTRPSGGFNADTCVAWNSVGDGDPPKQ